MTSALLRKASARAETQSFREPLTSQSDSIAAFSGSVIRRVVQAPRFPWIEAALEELKELCRLERGWDGYQGQPVSLPNAYFALQILENTCTEKTMKPQFIPGSRGDLQIEWHTSDVDLEIHVRAPFDVDVWFRDQTTGALGQEEYIQRDLGPLLRPIRELS